MARAKPLSISSTSSSAARSMRLARAGSLQSSGAANSEVGAVMVRR